MLVNLFKLLICVCAALTNVAEDKILVVGTNRVILIRQLLPTNLGLAMISECILLFNLGNSFISQNNSDDLLQLF